jgi:hypothetical protein
MHVTAIKVAKMALPLGKKHRLAEERVIARLCMSMNCGTLGPSVAKIHQANVKKKLKILEIITRSKKCDIPSTLHL